MRSSDGWLSRPESYRQHSADGTPDTGVTVRCPPHNQPPDNHPAHNCNSKRVTHTTTASDLNDSFGEKLGCFRRDFSGSDPSAQQDTRSRSELARHIWTMVSYRGIQYSSRSMAVCGALLESHVPGFKVKYGESLEVPVGERQHIDFLVGNCFVEYHPIVIKNELGNTGRYRRWVQRLKSLSLQDQNDFAEGKKDELLEAYFAKRRESIDRDPIHRGKELIAVRTPHTFWKEVLIRFGKGVPSNLDGFMSLFSTIMDRVTEENSVDSRRLRVQLLREQS